MISLIEALKYRCLRYVRQPLGPLHVLVGANASGKSTFLDVVGFLHELVTEGLEAAVMSRSANFYDLLWRHEGNRFELAIEARIPPAQLELLATPGYDTVRYEIAIALDAATNQLGIVAERGTLKISKSGALEESGPFPVTNSVPESIVKGGRDAVLLFEAPVTQADLSREFGWSSGVNSDAIAKSVPWMGGDMTVAVSEGTGREKGLLTLNRFDMKKCLLAKIAADEINFPVTTWLRELLSELVVRIALDSRKLARPSLPGQGTAFEPDGDNLPWVVAELERKSPKRHKEWVEHLQTALPDLINVTTIERPEDRHRYLSLVYRDGLKVPSWMVSDGTLRLLALTILAYLQDFKGIYLVEEPENGIHPLAIETMYQSLSSVYDAQVLVATHSPVILSITDLENVLCFRKGEAGDTEVVAGSEHPRLRDWHHEVDLGTMFASGVLG